MEEGAMTHGIWMISEGEKGREQSLPKAPRNERGPAHTLILAQWDGTRVGSLTCRTVR